jgi:MerR HTH family regulatory protein
MSIGEPPDRTGLTPHTLRYYEREVSSPVRCHAVKAVIACMSKRTLSG